MATLVEKQAELTLAKDALKAAQFAVSYGQGDRSVTRAQLPQLEVRVARLAREVAEMSAADEGASNPFAVTATWR